jgi:hypothetical protein
MVDKCTICLVGPKSAGKSSLLQTFVDCIELGAHGFSDEYDISVQDIDEEEYAGGQSVSRILGGNSGVYRDYRDNFFINQVQTDSTIEFFFRLTAGGTGLKTDADGKNSREILLRVVDSAGEYAVAENYGSARIDNPIESVSKLNDALMQADATIIVIPLVDLDRATFVGSLTGLIARLVNARGEKPNRIVVAFTQYEKLFLRAGRDAFATASLREIAQMVIRRAVEQGRWADDLVRFSEMPDREVYFTVTSSYGFAKGLGVPNIDPHWPSDPPTEQLFGKPGDIAAYWRPFLTADPFVSAAIDKPGVLTFTFDTLFPEHNRPGSRGSRQADNDAAVGPAKPAEPQRASFSTQKKHWWAGKLDWFNRKRDEHTD